jgi:mycothiol synthase
VIVRVRPFAERDYNAFARLRTTGEGEPTAPEDARARDARWDWSRYERVRLVAVDEEDAPLGYGDIHHEPSRFDPRRYFMGIAVDLRMRRRGIGDAIWRQLRSELDERGARGVFATARYDTAGERFITARGFREVIRWHTQVRAVTTAPLPTPAAEARLSAAGVRIATLAELRGADADALTKAHELYFASRLDQATLGRVTPTTFDAWHASHVDADGVVPEAYLVAMADDRYVGQTIGRRSRSEDVLDIAVTGVLPAYRRRGIARALKLRLHAYARSAGFHELHTRIARENVAMVALNDSLGYVIVESSGGFELAIPAVAAA